MYYIIGSMKIGIGIPTLNRADLLQENLDDLLLNFSDADSIHIIDNGFQDIRLPEGLDVYLETPGKNLGVAASWNKHMKYAFEEKGCDYILILNDDIVFGHTKEAVQEIIVSRAEPYLLTGTFYWSCLLISKACYEDVGGFDEGFYPAYYEDNDYARRLTLIELGHCRWGQDPRLDPIVKRNSMTIKKDPNLNKLFNKNKKYFFTKWGGYPGEEVYTIPFNGKNQG